MKDDTLIIADNLVRYFNGFKIGSILFFEAKILEYKDLNDIDLVFNSQELLDKARTYLIDNGYQDEVKQHYSEDGYKSFVGADNVFKKEGFKNIQILRQDGFDASKVYTLDKLVGVYYKENKKEKLLKIINKLK